MLVHVVSLGNLRLKIIIGSVAAFVAASSAFAAAPTIQIPRIERPPTLADFEAMHPIPAVSEHMVKVIGFIAREPADGAQPTQDTE
jgi:hypothetical protein